MAIDPTPTPSDKPDAVPDFAPAGPKFPVSSRALFIAGGGLGVVAAFLPLFSFSMQGMGGAMQASGTSIVFDDWRGKASTVGSLAALAFAFLLYPPGRSPAKPLVWTAVGVCVAAGLVGIWLMIDVLQARGSADFMGMLSKTLTPGVGLFLNALAVAAAAAAAMRKGREERLF